MSGFGDKLRREREMRGVTLEEISESTKIGTRSLRALEEDDFEKLPGGIFNKGFVRAYSRFLGLDEEETVADFDAAFKEYKLSKGLADPPLIVVEDPEPANSNSLFLASVALVVIAACAAGYFLVRARSQRASGNQVPLETRTVALDQQAAAQKPVATPEPPPVTALAPPAGEPTPEAKQTPIASAPDSTLAGAQTKTPATASTPSISPIRLRVFAREESWMSISADGQNLGQQLLAPQQSRTIQAQKEVRIKLGNVGGVEVSFNGKPVNIDGEPRQVKELTFTTDGLHP